MKIEDLSVDGAREYLNSISCLEKASPNHYKVRNDDWMLYVQRVDFWETDNPKCKIRILKWDLDQRTIKTFEDFLDSAAPETQESFLFHLDMFK